MSRLYTVEMDVEGLTEEQFRKVIEGNGYSIKEECCEGCDDPPAIEWRGTITLRGGVSTNEMHLSLEKDFKSINPEFKLETRWLCLEDFDWDDIYRSDD